MSTRKIAHYEILHELGEGGMGVVYKARDLHLDRLVALKVLRPERIGEVERKRFAQEARAASALNHPNIVQVYDVGSENGADYIVMEFVDGKPLDQLIAQRRMDLTIVLRHAIQLASALAKAHAAGIVHRDLKPSNVIVASDGAVKVLDFGLAKLLSPQTGELQSTNTLLHEPMHTEQGVIMGTVAYMAPEQAEGNPVDARADIFSFGAVLYEMITGQRAFPGKSKMSILSAVLTQEPAPIAEHAQVPRDLEKIVARCLRKDPDRRFQHIADVRVALEELKAERESGVTTAVETVYPSRRRFFAPAAAALVTAVVSVAGSWLYWRPEPPKPDALLTRVTADAGLTTDPALSPDGKMIAYASDRGGDGGLDIWIQQLANGESIRLTNDPSDDHQPSFSPDGSTIVFRSERDRGGIYTVPALGGEARLVVAEGYDPQYSPDGQSIAYWIGYAGTSLPARGWLFSLNGRTQRQILPDFAHVDHPRWSPDGKFLVFAGSKVIGQVGTSPSHDWWITPVDAGGAVQTGALAHLRNQGLSALPPTAWLASNQILFSATSGNASNIWRVPVSRPSLRVERRAERVTMGTQRETQPSGTQERLVAYAAENSAIEIWSLNLNPGAGGAAQDRVRLTGGAGANTRPSISRDGNVVAFVSNRTGTPRVWIRSLTRGAERALTGGSRPEYWPILSPDGTKVAFTTVQNPTAAAVHAGVPLLVAEIRTGVAQTVCPDCFRPEGWSPDGRKLLLGWPLSNQGEISEFDLAGRQRTVLVKFARRDVASPRYSPDGKWISFMERTSPETRQIWVAPLGEGELPIPPSRWIAITDNTAMDREARWSEDGSALYFTSNRDGFQCLWAQRLDPSTKQPAGSAAPLHHFHSALLRLTLTDSGQFGLSVGAGRMVISLGAATGNIWLMRQP